MATRPRAYDFDRFRLDAADRVLLRDGIPVPLTPKAVETLLVLVERHDQLVTKETLFQIVWPETFVEDNNLAQNISLLRRVLGARATGGPFIETVPKRGYRFVGEVVALEEGTPASPDVVAVAAVGAGTPVGRAGEAAQGTGSPERIPRLAIWGLAAATVVALVMVAMNAASGRESRSGANDGPRPSAGGSSDQRDGLTRIAVLPFRNLGPPGDAYFVAGMTEEITSRLAGLSGVAVPSGTTLTAYDRGGRSVRQVGDDLGVEYLVEGSVRWAPAAETARVRISPRLIRVADDTTVWTHQYDADLSDLFAVQADIAHQITGALEVALDARERLAVEARPTEDFDAYFAYLRGITAFRQGFSDTSNQAAARTAFEDAVARDPEFALAWSWLSRVYKVQYDSGAARTAEVRQAAHRAAETAVALQPGLPEAHLALAEALAVDGDLAGARRELDLARIGLPNSPDLWQLRGFVEQSKGRWLEARTAFMRAFDLDPASNAYWVGVYYLHMRQFDDARRFVDIAKAANHSAAAVPDAWIHVTERGDIAAARAVLESALEARSPGDARVRGLLAHLEWFDGRYDRALELIAGMDAAGGWLPPNFRFPASLAAGQVLDVTGRTREARENYAAAMAELKGRRTIDPGDYQIEAGLALAAAGLGRRTEALAHATRAVDLVPPATHAADWPLYAYLLARVQSSVGDYDAAFATLEELFTRPGFYSEHWVIRDPWFAPLRSHPSFEARLQRWASQKGDVLLRR